MRTIDNKQVPGMTSPVKPLFQHIEGALKAVAPEKWDEFLRLHDDLSIECLDCNDFVLHVDGKTRCIQLSRKVVEVVWCACFGWLRIHKFTCEKYDAERGKRIDLWPEEYTRPAVRLLKWAFEAWLNHLDDPWPDDLPQPIQVGEEGDYEQEATDNACLATLGFLCHHEFAHLRLGHDGPSIENEREADYAAIDWMLEKAPTPQGKEIRGYSCVIGLGILIAADIVTDTVNATKHPPSYDRLIHCLDRHFQNPDDPVWLLAMNVMSVSLTNGRVSSQWAPSKVANWRDAANQMANVMSTMNHTS